MRTRIWWRSLPGRHLVRQQGEYLCYSPCCSLCLHFPGLKCGMGSLKGQEVSTCPKETEGAPGDECRLKRTSRQASALLLLLVAANSQTTADTAACNHGVSLPAGSIAESLLPLALKVRLMCLSCLV